MPIVLISDPHFCMPPYELRYCADDNGNFVGVGTLWECPDCKHLFVAKSKWGTSEPDVWVHASRLDRKRLKRQQRKELESE